MGKKKKAFIIVSLVVLLVVIIVVAAFIYFRPFISAAGIAKELINEDYNYEIECYIEGVTLKEGQYGEHTVYIEGEKYGDSLRSYIYSEKEAYLEVFANTDWEIFFNIRPTCEFISNRLEEVLDIEVGDLVIDIEDTYLSIEDVEQIIDMDIVSMDDFGVNKSSDDKMEYKIERIDEPDEFQVDYDVEKSYYFQLTLSDFDTKVIVGVPSSSEDDSVYIYMKKDDIKLEMCVEYDKEETEEIEYPKSTFTEEQMESFKAAYKLWLIGKSILGKE